MMLMMLMKMMITNMFNVLEVDQPNRSLGGQAKETGIMTMRLMIMITMRMRIVMTMRMVIRVMVISVKMMLMTIIMPMVVIEGGCDGHGESKIMVMLLIYMRMMRITML